MSTLWIRDILVQMDGTSGALTLRPDGRGRQMRIVFEVTKSIGSTPNSATLRITNLSAESRYKVNREFDRVRIEAGHQRAGNRGIVFQGFIRDVSHRREGADIVTTIECGDGDKGVREGVISKSFPAGTRPAEMIDAILKEMPDVDRGVIHERIADLPPYPRPVVMCGPCRSELDKIGRTHRLYWSVQDGALEVVPGNGFVDDVTVISQRTGMIDVPEITDNGIRVKILLNPAIRIGRAIEVRSETLDMNEAEGRFRVSGVTFTGDTDPKGPFYADITGEKIDGAEVDEGRD